VRLALLGQARVRVEERKLLGQATAPLPPHWPPTAPPVVAVLIPPAASAAAPPPAADSAAEGEGEGEGVGEGVGEGEGEGEGVGEGEGEGEGEGSMGEEHERRIMAGTKLLGERLSSLGLQRIAADDDGNCLLNLSPNPEPEPDPEPKKGLTPNPEPDQATVSFAPSHSSSTVARSSTARCGPWTSSLTKASH
jgi:hypothetical protein